MNDINTHQPTFSEGDGAPRRKRDDQKYCSECAAIILAKAEICPQCGVRQLPATLPTSHATPHFDGKNRIVAAMLALFLGGLGAHRFYLGQTGMGIFYLLFCWTFIPSIIAFFEAIAFLVTSDEAFNQKYN